jgi:hypothetical protein
MNRYWAASILLRDSVFPQIGVVWILIRSLPRTLSRTQHYRRSLLTVNEVGGNQPNKNILCNLAAITGNTSGFAFSAASGLANLTLQQIQCVFVGFSGLLQRSERSLFSQLQRRL